MQQAHEGFEHLTMEQGLPSNMVLGMLFDKQGYLWAATGNGLSRYDGYEFVTYKFDPRDSLSLNQNLVFTLFEDDEGVLWIGTVEGGITPAQERVIFVVVKKKTRSQSGF